jgi:hypothetical protein
MRKPHLILLGAVAIGGLAVGTGECHADRQFYEARVK